MQVVIDVAGFLAPSEVGSGCTLLTLLPQLSDAAVLGSMPAAAYNCFGLLALVLCCLAGGTSMRGLALLLYFTHNYEAHAA
jgi:hypothetical protein